MVFDTTRAIIKESFPPKSRYQIDDTPDLTGKVFIVTGASSGIGKELTKQLLLRNGIVYLTARNKKKAEVTVAELKEQTDRTPNYLVLELGSLDSVKQAAEEFLYKETRLDVLYNNAGILWPALNELTTEGYNMQFGVHVLGPFYLTKLLLPTMLATAKMFPDIKPRIINFSSVAHWFPEDLRFDAFKYGSSPPSNFSSIVAYYQSKLAVAMYTLEQARRYGDQGIVSIILQPGNLDTELQRNAGFIRTILRMFFLGPVYPNGVFGPLWAGTTAEGAELNGKCVIPWARVGELPERASGKVGMQGELWTYLEEQLKANGK